MFPRHGQQQKNSEGVAGDAASASTAQASASAAAASATPRRSSARAEGGCRGAAATPLPLPPSPLLPSCCCELMARSSTTLAWIVSLYRGWHKRAGTSGKVRGQGSLLAHGAPRSSTALAWIVSLHDQRIGVGSQGQAPPRRGMQGTRGSQPASACTEHASSHGAAAQTDRARTAAPGCAPARPPAHPPHLFQWQNGEGLLDRHCTAGGGSRARVLLRSRRRRLPNRRPATQPARCGRRGCSARAPPTSSVPNSFFGTCKLLNRN